jgi:hypothetical protein
VRVSSEKQTLILAGESVPQRDPASRRPITIIATPVDDPKLLVQRDYEPSGSLPQSLAVSNRLTDRSKSFSAASAYARTQELSAGGGRKIIIDAYA